MHQQLSPASEEDNANLAMILPRIVSSTQTYMDGCLQQIIATEMEGLAAWSASRQRI